METARVIIFNNPVNPRDNKTCFVKAGVSIHDFLHDYHYSHLNGKHDDERFTPADFDSPHVILNSKGYHFPSRLWDEGLKANETYLITPVSRNVITAVFIVIALLAFVAFAFLLELPKPPDSIDEPDSVYDIGGRRNQSKLGKPIEVLYGNPRHYFSYASEFYTRYEDNKAIAYFLYVVTQGEAELKGEDIYIDDTVITSYEDVTWKVYKPFEIVDMFADNVETSDEISDIELYGPNDEDYLLPDGWTQWYTLNSEGTRTQLLEFDYGFPQGLYYSDNNLQNTTCTIEVEVREVGGNVNVVEDTKTHTLATNTPQRFTASYNVPAGRYQIRFRRTTTEDNEARRQDTVRVISARAFLPSIQNYGNVTILAVKIQATNQINDRNSNIVNGYPKRKIRTWDSANQVWTQPIITSNPIWAFLDVCQNTEYGRGLDDEFFDLDEYATLATTLENEGREFHWVFDRRTGVLNTLQSICSSFRAKPIIQGSEIKIFRELPQSVPVAVFNDNNILKGSFQHTIDTLAVGEQDGVTVEYIDKETWKRKSIECLVGDDAGTNTEKVNLTGQTNRTFSFRDGLFYRSKKKYQKERVKFSVEMEGFLLSYGDLIAVSSEIPQWGIGGVVNAINVNLVTLDKEINFSSYQGRPNMMIRKRNGVASIPYTITQFDSYTWDGTGGNYVTIETSGFGVGSIEIKVKIDPTKTQQILLGSALDDFLLAADSVDTTPDTVIKNTITYSNVQIDGVETALTTRQAFFNAIADNEEHTIKINGLDFSTLSNTNLVIGTFIPNQATWEILGSIYDTTIIENDGTIHTYKGNHNTNWEDLNTESPVNGVVTGSFGNGDFIGGSASILDANTDISDFATIFGEENPIYLLGDSNNSDNFYSLCVVENLQPNELKSVEIEAYIYDARVFNGDSAIAPPDDAVGGFTNVIIDNPVIAELNVIELESPKLSLTWSIVFGALHYEIEESLDGLNYYYLESSDTNSYILDNNELDTSYYFRVRAVTESKVGAWTYWEGKVFAVSHNRVTSNGDNRITDNTDNRITG